MVAESWYPWDECFGKPKESQLHTYNLMLNFSPYLPRKREIGQCRRSFSLVTPMIVPRDNVNYGPNVAQHLRGPHK